MKSKAILGRRRLAMRCRSSMLTAWSILMAFPCGEANCELSRRIAHFRGCRQQSWPSSPAARCLHCSDGQLGWNTKRDTGEPMEYTTLGRTGLRVSVAGLGCGGVCRVGGGTRQKEGGADAPHPRAPHLWGNPFATPAAPCTTPGLG